MEKRSGGTRMTTQSDGMSCSAWRRLVQPAIMNPTAAVNNDRNFMKWRTVACPNDSLSPDDVTTCNPTMRLPKVARWLELSVKAQYNQASMVRKAMAAMPLT